MAECNSVNVKLSDSQLNKLKSATKSETWAMLILSSNVTGYWNDEPNIPHKLLLTNRQVVSLCKAFANNLSTDLKLSKTQLSKIV